MNPDDILGIPLLSSPYLPHGTVVFVGTCCEDQPDHETREPQIGWWTPGYYVSQKIGGQTYYLHHDDFLRESAFDDNSNAYHERYVDAWLAKERLNETRKR